MSSFLSLFQVSASAAQATGRETVRPEAARGANDTIANAFASASQTTGLPFDYFMTTAMRESSLDVNAAASTSSARGPFQFIEQTWLGMVHEHGSALGLGEEAAAIERQANGRFSVADPQARQDLLAMRHDPELSAVMSGLYLQGNASDLEAALGRQITVGEGYVAHVFGPSGASRLISLAEQQPNRVAADVFPTQAEANRGLFYDRSGSPVSLRELYDRLVEGFPSEPVRTDGVMSAQASSTRAPAVPVDPTQPMQLEPEGFDALPEAAARVAPDDLENRGLFTAGGRDQLPFFAALYRPDGVEPPVLGEEYVATHGQNLSGGTLFDTPATSDPFALQALGRQGGLIAQQPAQQSSQAMSQRAHSAERVVPAVSSPAENLPLDLLQFVQSGTLADRYRNPARESVGSELVPPV